MKRGGGVEHCLQRHQQVCNFFQVRICLQSSMVYEESRQGSLLTAWQYQCKRQPERKLQCTIHDSSTASKFNSTPNNWQSFGLSLN